MTEKFSLTLTPEEARDLLMARVERSLRDNGVTLTQEARDQIRACLPVPDGSDVRVAPPAPAVERPVHRPTVQEARAVLEQTKTPAGDNRARVYRPTTKASEIPTPASTRDRVLNLIVKSNVCTLNDLVKGTHRPKKAIYTALWALKREKLIDIQPLASLQDESNRN